MICSCYQLRTEQARKVLFFIRAICSLMRSTDSSSIISKVDHAAIEYDERERERERERADPIEKQDSSTYANKLHPVRLVWPTRDLLDKFIQALEQLGCALDLQPTNTDLSRCGTTRRYETNYLPRTFSLRVRVRVCLSRGIAIMNKRQAQAYHSVTPIGLQRAVEKVGLDAFHSGFEEPQRRLVAQLHHHADVVPLAARRDLDRVRERDSTHANQNNVSSIHANGHIAQRSAIVCQDATLSSRRQCILDGSTT